MDPFPSQNGRSNYYFCRLDAFSHLRSWGSFSIVFLMLQNRAQTIGASTIFKKCDSPGGLVHTFARLLPFAFYALWVRSGTLALEVLQKKKLMTPLVRECHFFVKVCKSPARTSKNRMLLPLVFYAPLIFGSSRCLFKIIFWRPRGALLKIYVLPVAVLTQFTFFRPNRALAAVWRTF